MSHVDLIRELWVLHYFCGFIRIGFFYFPWKPKTKFGLWTRVLRVKQKERIVFPEAQQNINNWVVVGSSLCSWLVG